MTTLPSPDPVDDRLKQLPPAEKQALLARLRQLAHPPWEQIARPEQLPPDWPWDIWMILAGRGWGKTRTGAEFVSAKAREYPGCRIALVAQAFADGRDTMVEGESGLLSVLAEHELRSGSRDAAWNRSLGELFMANGSQFKIYSSEKPRQLRGPQHHFAWVDEPATLYDAHKGPAEDTTWSNLMFGLRLVMSKPIQWTRSPVRETVKSSPQIVVTGTPKPVKLLTKREGEPKGLLHREGVAITRGRTVENRVNLAKSFRRAVIDPLRGTRLGRQELDGEVLEDVEGAMVKREWIEAARATHLDEGQVHARTVGLDPGDPGAQRSQALCQMARTADGTLWVERSERMGGPVSDYLRHALRVAQGAGATIVVERNFGGQALIELCRSVMRELGIIVPVREVVASTGKRVRAEPVALLIETGRCRFAGRFEGLEDDWATFDGTGPSPHELDACLVGGTRVLTEAGERPIEAIRPGERVWTRKGWRAVLASARTRVDAPVGTITLADGTTLTGTAEHPVWVQGRGFVSMDAIRWGDRIQAWIPPPKSSSTGSGIAGIPTQMPVSAASTTTLSLTGVGCIASSGSTPTGRLFLTGCTSTTSTATRSTTGQRTCSPSSPASIADCIPRMMTSRRGCAGISPPTRSPELLSGTVLLRAASGIASTASSRGRAASASMSLSARGAGRSSRRFGPTGRTAPRHAEIGTITGSGATRFRSRVRSAAPSSGRTSTAPSPRRALARVARSFACSGRADVFNLTVADCPEFVANGILVHNCVWASHALMGSTLVGREHELMAVPYV